MFLLWIKSEEGNDAELQTVLYRGAPPPNIKLVIEKRDYTFLKNCKRRYIKGLPTATEYKIAKMKLVLALYKNKSLFCQKQNLALRNCKRRYI